ncbi:MAG: hypothetical protein ACOWWR_20365 [Eubacteriales bacterium]
MNVDVFDEVMLFDGKTLKVNDRILYSFNEELPTRLSTHFSSMVPWIQAYIDNFLKGKNVEDISYNESIYYEINEDSLLIVDRETIVHLLTFGTKKPEVRRIIAIGTFEYIIGMI